MHPKWGQNSNFWPSNVKLTSGCTSVPTKVVCLRKYKPSNRTTSRLLHCPNGRRLMLNTFNPRWRSNAAGGPIQSLREQVGLRPKLRCAPQKVLKSWSFLTENILKREKPNAGENSLIKLIKAKWSLDQWLPTYAISPLDYMLVVLLVLAVSSKRLPYY